MGKNSANNNPSRTAQRQSGESEPLTRSLKSMYKKAHDDTMNLESSINSKIEQLEKKLKEKDAEIEQTKKYLERIQRKITQKDTVIMELDQKLTVQNAEVLNLKSTDQFYTQKIGAVRGHCKKLENEIGKRVDATTQCVDQLNETIECFNDMKSIFGTMVEVSSQLSEEMVGIKEKIAQEFLIEVSSSESGCGEQDFDNGPKPEPSSPSDSDSVGENSDQ